MPKLYVNKSWFVEVDEEGYYQGPLGEGVFGCVLCLRGTEDIPGNARRAWKLPRLLADTLEENAYIEGLLRQESNIVQLISNVDSTGIAQRALVRCYDSEREGEFWGRRRFEEFLNEVEKQDHHVFFIQFEKAKRPRLCLVDFKGTLSVFPKGAEAAVRPLLSTQSWDRLSGLDRIQFAKASFLAQPQHQPIFSHADRNVIAGNLKDAGASRNPFHSWFTGVASILWEWASMNLQEAISRTLLVDWILKDHLSLWKQILDGVVCLHANALLHADLRPANIFAVGSPANALNYKLGDYGSLTSGDGFAGPNQIHVGDTVIGPDVGRGRSSPFYSLERRSGVERETADTAIVIYNAEQKDYRIWCGWKSQVLDDKGNLKDEVADQMHRLAVPPSSQATVNSSLDSLRPGDRIRLRDQVYRVKQLVESDKSLGVLEGGLLCVCQSTFATVVHDKLTVYDLREPDNLPVTPQVIPLSSYVELRQWSAATDLFSLGALFLYTLYSVGRQKGYLPKHKLNEGDVSAHDLSMKSSSESMVIIDAEFRQSMAVLESIPYLKVLWSALDGLWKEITTARNQALALKKAERREIYDQLSLRLRHDNELLTVVSNITASVPNSKVLLQYFDCNMVRFVLFFHFILRCLHRREHLEKGDNLKKLDNLANPDNTSETLPFCQDRTEKPMAHGAAENAAVALKELENLLEDDNLLDEQVGIEEVPDYDVRSEYLVKIDNEQLKIKSEKLKSEIEQLSGENADLRSWKKAMTSELQRIIQQRQICAASTFKGKPTNALFEMIDAVEGSLTS